MPGDVSTRSLQVTLLFYFFLGFTRGEMVALFWQFLLTLILFIHDLVEVQNCSTVQFASVGAFLKLFGWIDFEPFIIVFVTGTYLEMTFQQ